MAEQVQFRLETQIPELEDLQRKGIFTKEEIREIVKNRSKHEYALERRIARKEDFLRYIEYEMNLEALRKKRKSRLFVDKTYKMSLSDYSILRRIQNLFDRATKKFAGDVTLWLQYFKWAQDNNRKRTVNSVLSRAIQKHPRNPTLWMLAANHEINVNTNATAARALFQRGLRLCGDSHDLWAAYHLMEVEYTEKIRERRKVLGIGAEHRKQHQASSQEAQELDQSGDGFEGDFIKLPELLAGEVASFKEGNATEEPAKKRRRTQGDLEAGVAEALDNEGGSNPFLNGEIGRVVYCAAISSIPSDLEFRKRLLQNYEPFASESPAAQAGKDEVYESLRRDFPDLPEARELVARRHLADKELGTAEWFEAVRETAREFAETVRELDTKEIHDLRCAFLREALEKIRKQPAAKEYLVKVLSKAYSEAFKSGKASADLVSKRVDFTHQILQDRAKALKLATQAVDLDEYSKSPEVWLALAAVTNNWKEALEKGLVKIPESVDLWKAYFAKLEGGWAGGKVQEKEVFEKYKNALRLSTTIRDVVLCELLMISYLDFTMRTPSGARKARELARELALRSLPTPGFWKRCMDYEEDFRAGEGERERKESFAHSSWLAERLVNSSKADPNAWERSAKVRIQAGEYAEAAAVFQRARAALSSGAQEEFERSYAALLASAAEK